MSGSRDFLYVNGSAWNRERGRLHAIFASQSKRQHEKLVAASREAARDAACFLANVTYPSTVYGGSLFPRARKHITEDIHKIFATASTAYGILARGRGEDYAKAFYKSYMSGDMASATRILRDSGCISLSPNVEIGPPDRAIHQVARIGDYGRVPVGIPLRLICRKEELDAYIASVVGRLGESAAGWSACAVVLGGDTGVLAWKSAYTHGMKNGFVTENTEPGHVTVTLHNTCDYINNNLTARQIVACKQEAREYLIRLMER